MIEITVAFQPGGGTDRVILKGVPSVGHSIRLKNGPDNPVYRVEHVLWMEEPVDVIVSVREEPTR